MTSGKEKETSSYLTNGEVGGHCTRREKHQRTKKKGVEVITVTTEDEPEDDTVKTQNV